MEGALSRSSLPSPFRGVTPSIDPSISRFGESICFVAEKEEGEEIESLRVFVRYIGKVWALDSMEIVRTRKRPRLAWDVAPPERREVRFVRPRAMYG